MTRLIEITGKVIAGEWGEDDLAGEGIPVLRTTNFTNIGVVNYDNIVTRIIKKKNLKDKLLRYGDIIIEKSGGSDTQPVGRVIFFEGEEEKYLFNNFTGLLRVKNRNLWNPKYVFYTLFANYAKGMTVPYENRTTGLHNLQTDSYINATEVINRGINEQNKIVYDIDKVVELVNLHKKQLKDLDIIIKSRFIEMFGLPFGTHKYSIKKLKDISTSISDGSNIDKTYYMKEGEVLFLRIQNVWSNEFRLQDSVYITKEVNSKYFDTSLHKGDLLITKIGRFYTQDSSLGRVSVYLGDNDKANYSNNIMRIRLDNSVLSEYVNSLFNLDDYNKYIRKVSVGGTDKRALSKAIIGDLPVIMAPMELQREYVNFLAQVDKSKLAVQQSLNELETLKKSLMQQYFG